MAILLPLLVAFTRNYNKLPKCWADFLQVYLSLTLGHALAGQQKMIVLKINEYLSSQIPSCWVTDYVLGGNENLQNHPPIPVDAHGNQTVPLREDRLQNNHDSFAVRQCPHCEIVWNRDVNACR